MFCRVAAKELSILAPHLAKANVRLIGIGLEELGVEEFMEGKFFDGGQLLIYSLIVGGGGEVGAFSISQNAETKQLLDDISQIYQFLHGKTVLSSHIKLIILIKFFMKHTTIISSTCRTLCNEHG